MRIYNKTIGKCEKRFIQVKAAEAPDGTSINIPVWVIRGKSDEPKLFVNAAIHGDELNGILTVKLVVNKLNPKKLEGTVIAVPIVNTVAYMHECRFNPFDKIDMNRVFPGDPSGSLTERIAYVFFEEIVKRCDYGVDLHTATTGHLFLPHARLLEFKPEVINLAEIFGTEILMEREGVRGMLAIEASRIGIPTVTVELGEALRLDRRYVREGYRGVLNIMKHLEMIEGEPIIPAYQVVVKEAHEVRSNEGGLLTFRKHVGDIVDKGDLIARVINPLKKDVEEIKAPVKGLMLGMRTKSLTFTGAIICTILGLEYYLKWRKRRPEVTPIKRASKRVLAKIETLLKEEVPSDTGI